MNFPSIGSFQEAAQAITLIEDVTVVTNLAQYAKAFKAAKTLQPYSKFLVCNIVQNQQGTWIQILAENMTGWFCFTSTTKLIPELGSAAAQKIRDLEQQINELRKLQNKTFDSDPSPGHEMSLEELPRLWEKFLFIMASEIRSILVTNNYKKLEKYSDTQLVKYVVTKEVFSTPFSKKVPALTHLVDAFYQMHPYWGFWREFYQLYGKHPLLLEIVNTHSKVSRRGWLPQPVLSCSNYINQFWVRTYEQEQEMHRTNDLDMSACILLQCGEEWFTTFDCLRSWCEAAIQERFHTIKTTKLQNS